MNEMEDELRRALRRVDPPEGFADRVRQRAAATSGRSRRSPRTAAQRWAAAAMLAAAVSGGVWYRADLERKKAGEEAKRQVLLSLRIASDTLRSVQITINRGEERQ